MPTKLCIYFSRGHMSHQKNEYKLHKSHGERERYARKVRFIWGRRQAITRCAPPPPPTSPLEHPRHGAGWVTSRTLGRPGSFSSRLDTPPSRA